MLFTNIAALVRQGVKLSIAVEASGSSKIDVTVTPSSADAASNKSGVSLVAKTFTATPEEFDAEFAALLQTFCTSTLSLKDQMEAANQLMEQAGKQASETAIKSTTKSPSKPGASKASLARAQPELTGEGAGTEQGDDGDEQEDESSDVASATGATADAGQPSLELKL